MENFKAVDVLGIYRLQGDMNGSKDGVMIDFVKISKNGLEAQVRNRMTGNTFWVTPKDVILDE